MQKHNAANKLYSHMASMKIVHPQSCLEYKQL